MIIENILQDLPTKAPAAPKDKLRFADVAVTATAKEFAGIYRNKQQHEPDMLAVLERGAEAGVEKVMLTGMSLADVDFNLNIASQRSQQCFITVGVHPYHASELVKGGTEYVDRLVTTVKELIARTPSPIAAYGELGLDYDHLAHASKEDQMNAFKSQLDAYVTHKFDLPLFLHCRAAFHDFIDIIKPYLPRLPKHGLVHSFVGTTDQMQALVEMGFNISVNGFSFRDNESLKMVAAIPLDKLQIETDAPWGEIPASSEISQKYLANARPLPPSKKKDKFEMGSMVKTRNESCAIDRVALIVAGVKGISVDEVSSSSWQNSMNMFRFGTAE